MLSLFQKRKVSTSSQLKYILGFKPTNVHLYDIALTHPSVANNLEDNYERLEFLGDAFLGSVIAAYLYRRYPKKDEGFLTEMRAKMVGRNTLNYLTTEIGLDMLIKYNEKNKNLKYGKMFGNVLEAFIGAIYLDKGYAKTKKFILNQLILKYLDLDELELQENNYKKIIYQWVQKENKKLNFELLDIEEVNKRKIYKVGIVIEEEIIATGTGWNKKEAEQNASSEAISLLGLV